MKQASLHLAALLLLVGVSAAQADAPTDAEILRAKLAALHRRWEALGGVAYAEKTWQYYFVPFHYTKGEEVISVAAGFQESWESYTRAQGPLVYEFDQLGPRMVDGLTARIARGRDRDSGGAQWNYYERDSAQELAQCKAPLAPYGTSDAFGFFANGYPGRYPIDAYEMVHRLDDEGLRWSVRFKEPVAASPKPQPCYDLEFDHESGLLSRVTRWDEGVLFYHHEYVSAWDPMAGEYLPLSFVRDKYFTKRDGGSRAELTLLNVSFSQFSAWCTGNDDAPEAYSWTAMGVDPESARNIPIDYYRSGATSPLAYILHRGRLYEKNPSAARSYRQALAEAAKNPAVLFTSPWAITLWAPPLGVVALLLWILGRRKRGTPAQR